MKIKDIDPASLVARCQEIQINLGLKDVPEFEAIPELGMSIRLALHIRGLPKVKYEVLKLVSYHYLDIPRLATDRIVHILAEVEFVRLQSEGDTIKLVIPTVPYYEDAYKDLGDYAESSSRFSEAEQLALTIVDKLAKSPEKRDALQTKLGAEKKLFDRSIDIGTQGAYLISRKHRGRVVIINPAYFSENQDIFADHVAAVGAHSIQDVITKVKRYQGWPLTLIEAQKKIGSLEISDDQINLLKRIAQDGMIKPPSISTTHAGDNFFMFTPTLGKGGLSPTKRDIYERALAIVSAVRQGQLLPKQYAIRSPGAVLYTLKTNLRLKKATTEFCEQYNKLVHLRVGQIVPAGNGYSHFEIIDTPENREALDIAYSLIEDGSRSGLEVDEEARKALQSDQEYAESLIAARELRSRVKLKLSEHHQDEIDRLFLKG